jgi:pyruvate formate lyase activating enzyme
LSCQFCQNSHISKPPGSKIPDDFLSPDDFVAAAVREQCPSIAFTYNEPITFAEYVIDTSIKAHEAGLRTVAVTAGHITEHARPNFFEHLDAANIDLKFFRPDTYRRLSGVQRDPILETLRYVSKTARTHLEITTLLIPGINDGDDELRDLTQWIAAELGPDVPLHFSAFHGAHHMMDHPATPPQTLYHARDVAREAGIRYVYLGNIRETDTNNTDCPGCGLRLVTRSARGLVVTPGINSGLCRNCGAAVAGVF